MEKIELAPDDFMRKRFTCVAMTNKDIPGRVLYFTTMGLQGGHQLYRNEAESLMVNIGTALGIDVEGACNAHDLLVDAVKSALAAAKAYQEGETVHFELLAAEMNVALLAAGATP